MYTLIVLVYVITSLILSVTYTRDGVSLTDEYYEGMSIGKALIAGFLTIPALFIAITLFIFICYVLLYFVMTVGSWIWYNMP